MIAILPLLWSGLLCAASLPHDGPDPIAEWRLEPAWVEGGQARARLGLPAELEGTASFVEDEAGAMLMFDGRSTRGVVGTLEHAAALLPAEHLTLAAWVSINTPRRWGGIVGAVQDDADVEKGWVLGYDQDVFTIALSSVGADDGDGRLTYLRGTTRYEEGRLHFVVATYDGERLKLYVDGKLEAESTEQSGAVLYPAEGILALGGYFDANEAHHHHGRIAKVQIFDLAAEAEWVADAFDHGRALANAKPFLWLDPEFRWVVQPYLQWVTPEGITVMWETTRPSTSVVEYGEFAEKAAEGEEPTLPKRLVLEGTRRLHEVRLEGFAPESAVYYRVRTVDDQGRELVGPLRSFQTAVRPRHALPLRRDQ